MKSKILIIDDDLDLGILLASFLKKAGFDSDRTIDPSKALRMIKETSYALVLCDFRLPGKDGLEMLREIGAMRPGLPVIIITGYSEVRIAVKAMQLGAADYVTKPIIPDELLSRIEQVLQRERATPATEAVPAPKAPKPAAYIDEKTIYTGSSASFQKVLEYVELVGPTDMTVIVEGATGSGKELVAQMIHRSSNRASQPYLAVDCGAIPDNLAASELFGHLKGAFTGAIRNRDGYFMQANGGTLFLDEIGNLSYEIQVQLLRVLQEGVLRRVGETDLREVDVRVVVATNESLLNMVDEGTFRTDLYHRLNEFKIRVPSLKDRKEDLEGFAMFFLEKANQSLGKQVTGFSKEAMEVLMAYHWPGNLRELGNVVKRAVLLAGAGQISEAELPEEIVYVPDAATDAPNGKSRSGSVSPLRGATEQAEIDMIMQALRAVNFNRTKAAARLGIDRKTLYNKMKAYGIAP